MKSVDEFLSFRDWLMRKEHREKDWISVACSQEKRHEQSFEKYYTFSVLASAGEDSKRNLLSTHHWEAHPPDVLPNFYISTEDELLYDSGLEKMKDGIKYRPFTYYRSFHDYIPSTFELVQNFLLYHEAFYIENIPEYQRINDDGDVESVVRILKDDEGNLMILVDVHMLRDYLSANHSYLVRYHDHRRWSTSDITGKIQGEYSKNLITSDTSCFEGLIAKWHPATNGEWKRYKSYSTLLGKDIVLPYPEPDKKHRHHLTGEIDQDFVSFIIGRDENGERITATCNEKELSNLFTDRGTPQFLTPVYFKREVLSKYYQESRRYQAGRSYVSCLSLWGLEFDTTDEELIQVWLGDLGKIPYKEQLHWRQYNVAPKGTITRARFSRDFMNEPIEPDDPIYRFRKVYEIIQRMSEEKWNESIFKNLEARDEYLYDTLHLPVTMEWKEFDEQLLALAKITSSSLNIRLLERLTGQKHNRDEGSIHLLGIYLYQIGVQEDTKTKILEGLRIVQRFRSTSAAHQKRSKLDKYLKDYNLSSLANKERVRRIVLKLAEALNLLIIEIEHE